MSEEINREYTQKISKVNHKLRFKGYDNGNNIWKLMNQTRMYTNSSTINYWNLEKICKKKY
jgi:hypothetical protein